MRTLFLIYTHLKSVSKTSICVYIEATYYDTEDFFVFKQGSFLQFSSIMAISIERYIPVLSCCVRALFLIPHMS